VDYFGQPSRTPPSLGKRLRMGAQPVANFSWSIWMALATIAAVSIPLFIIDVRSHRLPNAYTYPAVLVIAAGLSIAQQWTAITCGLVAGLGMLALNLATRGGVGMGDVKLSVSLGMASGAIGVGTCVMVFVFAFLIGGIWAVAGLATRRYTRKTAIAFGPALLIGFWAAIISVML
jgi:leader peptidase (prepilin peptidase)/N-methyltransferase